VSDQRLAPLKVIVRRLSPHFQLHLAGDLYTGPKSRRTFFMDITSVLLEDIAWHDDGDGVVVLAANSQMYSYHCHWWSSSTRQVTVAPGKGFPFSSGHGQ